MKAGELTPDDRFTLVNCEPYLEGVVYTVRRQYGNYVECWNDQTMRCYISVQEEVKREKPMTG